MKIKIGFVLLMIMIGGLIAGCGRQINEEQYIDVNGVNLAYIEQGEGPPLILLHGGGGSGRDFDHIIGPLSENYTIYAIDSRGQGKSSAVKEYHYQDMADDVAAFIEEKGLKRPALYGFSDGGITGLLIASQQPDLLSSMVISGANADPEGIASQEKAAMEQSYYTSRDPLLKMELEEPDITAADLNQIKIPVLVLAGSDDMITEEHTRWIAEQIPESRLQILEGESHISYVLGSTKIADLIEAFLEGSANDTPTL